MIPPSLIDYVISRNLADGVVLAGCAERSCYHRLGVGWTRQRIAGERDPYLRARVPRERLTTIWASPTEQHRFTAALAEFTAALADLPSNGQTAVSGSPTDAGVSRQASKEAVS
jgi:coenzyme F420-reducing hydrogenase delta subunit